MCGLDDYMLVEFPISMESR